MKKIVLPAILAVSLFGFNTVGHHSFTSNIEGKVIKAYTQEGYGKHSNQWLFMDIKDKDGKIHQIAIAPTFKIANLNIKEGDNVKIDGFTSSMFQTRIIKAVDIYDLTQKKDYPISHNGYKNHHHTMHYHTMHTHYEHY